MKISEMTYEQCQEGLEELERAYDIAISRTNTRGSGFRAASFRRNCDKYLARMDALAFEADMAQRAGARLSWGWDWRIEQAKKRAWEKRKREEELLRRRERGGGR